MSNENETIDLYSPGRLLLIVVISTFVIETLVMYLLSLLPQAPSWVHMLLDSALLVVLSFPALYFFSFRPMAQHRARRAQVEAALKKAYDELERRIQERTVHLEKTNQELQYEIAERKRVEEALRESEVRYHSLFNAMTEGFALHEIVCDENGAPCDYRFLDVNPAFERLTGLKRADVASRTHNEVLPGDSPRWLQVYGAVALTGEPAQFVDYSPALQRHYEVFAYRPAPRQFAVVFKDITERKQAEEQDQRHLKGLEFLSAAGLYLLELKPEEDILSYIGQQVKSQVQDGLVIVNSFDPDGNTTTLHALFGSQNEMACLEEIVGRSPIGLTFTVTNEYREMMRGGELQQVPGGLFGLVFGQMPLDLCKQIEAQLRVARVHAMPFAANGDLLGTIAILSHEARPIPAAPMITAFIGMAAVAMQRRRVEEALRTSEARLNRSQEIAHLGGWELDLVKNRLTWSDEVYRIFGLQPQEFGATYEAFLERVHPDDRAAVDAAYSSSLREGKVSYEIEHRVVRKATGEIRWVHEKCQHIVDATGKIFRSLGMVLDITDRKRAEAEIRMLARFPQENPTPVLRVAKDGLVLYANPASADLLACWNCSVGGRLPAPWHQLILDTLDCGVPREEEVVCGRQVVSLSCAPIVEDGYVNIYGRDVTERRLAEEALRKAHDELEMRVQERTAQLIKVNQMLQAEIGERTLAEQSLQLERTKLNGILDAMPDGIYIVNQQREIQYVNPVLERAYGPVNGCKCYEYLHGRREPCPWCLNDAILAGQSFQTEQYSDRTGKTHELFEQPLRNADGTLSKLKIMHDITARKQAEDEIKQLYEAEQRARRTAEILRGASQALTQSLDLNTVLDTLLDYAGQIVPYDSASVILLEGESHLVVRAGRGYERWADPEQIRAISFDAQANPIAYALVKQRQSVLIADTHEYPGWEFHPGTEHIRSWLGVPLAVEGKVIGLCGLDKVEQGFFTQAHLQLVEALVGQAAVAIQNAWLFEQVRAGRERLAALSHRLVQVQDAERGYIARELHDEAGQSLTMLLLGLRLLKEEANEPAAIVAGVDELSHMVEGVLEELHRLAIDLRPASLDHLGLIAALRQHINAVRRKYGLMAGFEEAGFGDERLPPAVETNLYRIVQEALTNIVRHAQATHVQVLLERRGNQVIAAVVDNGIGFDPSAALAQEGRLGLFGMRERAEMMGGTFVVESAAGAGTTVSVEVPCDYTRTDYR